jgi:hypothetical protein
VAVIQGPGVVTVESCFRVRFGNRVRDVEWCVVVRIVP